MAIEIITPPPIMTGIEKLAASPDLSGIEKLAKARWFGHLRGLLKSRQVAKSEAMISRLTSGKAYPGNFRKLQNTLNLRATVGSGGIKNKMVSTGDGVLKLTDEGIINATKRSSREMQNKIIHDPLLKSRSSRNQMTRNKRDAAAEAAAPKKMANLHPEQEVEILHGGTSSYAKSFSSGQAKGVATEGVAGSGIWVHPAKDKAAVGSLLKGGRHQTYQDLAVMRYGSTPGTLSGTVKAKHLKGVPNDYEAVLSSTGMKHVKNLKVKSSYSNNLFGMIPSQATAPAKTFSSFQRPVQKPLQALS